MPVPETTVNEYRHTVSNEDDIGATRQVAATQRKPKTQPVKHAPNSPFRFGIFAFDAAHVPASMFSRKSVHLPFPGCIYSKYTEQFDTCLRKLHLELRSQRKYRQPCVWIFFPGPRQATFFSLFMTTLLLPRHQHHNSAVQSITIVGRTGRAARTISSYSQISRPPTCSPAVAIIRSSS